ncbi:circularly permuted type 2 ATP-grasp protein [Streptomyces sp. SID13031]|uniref:circularly permuted type 2 ATP-grasp protein n=1 Tax=Streptomyces sp. SID13031 TaxID=2706046 RepID=UPI0013C84EC0|nr:circularly permuted type 2 ATP-grasp protein [Streptomyces sp. SID13031]NEA34108.1 circularly permuted type 2 ATP-grasp protein [Streptomyces sp. SID13031]
MDFDWRGTSFDYWEELPQATKDKVLAAGAEDWKKVFSGVLTFNKSWRPLRPVMIHQTTYDALAQVMDRLLGLLLETGMRRARTAGELRKLLGTPDGLIEYLDDDEVLGEQLIQSGRPDILISDGVPKFVEFNVGSEAGCVWDTERVSTRFLTMFADHGLATLDGADGPVKVDAPPSPVDGRYQAIIDTLGLKPGDRLTTVLRTEGEYPGSDNLPAIVRSLDPFVERGAAFGIDGDVAPLIWLEADENGALVNQGRPVEAVFRLFVCTDMPQLPGQAALKAAVESGRSKLFTSSAGWLLANKIMLAFLWDDIELLAPEDQELVRLHVPWSRLITAELLDDAVARQALLVLKPADEYGGAGVLVGHETDPGAWREGLEEAIRRGGYLLQDYVRPDRLTMDFTNIDTGEHLQVEVPYSVGPYTFGRKSFGCFLRVGSHEHGEVLNLKRAIHVTGPLLVTT